MIKTYKNLLLFAVFSSIIVITGCKKMTDLNINTDPNNPVSAPLNLILTAAQLNGVGAFTGVNTTAHGLVGILGGDWFNMNANSFGGTWNNFYANPMKDLDEIIKASTATNSPHYLGVAQVMKAYFFGQFVDLFNDIPYTESLNGNAATAIHNPKFDKGKDIYDNLIKLCDDAIVNFAKTSPVPVRGDLIYNGNITRWRKVAYTVKLRLLMNSRLVRPNAQADIAALLATPANLISTTADDFTFRYNKETSPEGRHPWFQSSYRGDNSFSYMSTQFITELLDNDDPRMPYYIRRQTGRILNPNNPTDRGTMPAYNGYSVLEPAFWNKVFISKGKTPTGQDSIYVAGLFTRVRGDNTGIPADGALRVAPGAYPAGGLFDYPYSAPASTVRALTGGTGSGNGIFPLITSNMVKWWTIEHQLAYATVPTVTTRTLFGLAMNESITNVVSLSKNVDPLATDANATQVTSFVNSWLTRFDNASTDRNRLDVVLKQAWFSNFGNGLEIYSTFRRTGLPTSIDIPITRIRQFALRLPYPDAELNLNPNAASYKSNIYDVDGVFWDVLKFKF